MPSCSNQAEGETPSRVARPGSRSPRSQHQGTSLSGLLLSRDRSPTSFKGPSGRREVCPSETNRFPWVYILISKLRQATRYYLQYLEESIVTTKKGTKAAHVQGGVKRPVGKVKRKTNPAGNATVLRILVRSWTSRASAQWQRILQHRLRL